jgi:hypothetical protein
MKILIAFLSLCMASPSLLAAPAKENSSFSFRVESAAAEAVLDIFEKGKVSPAELDELVKMDDIATSIRHASQFNSEASEEMYKQSLVDVLNGKKPASDPFQFGSVMKRHVETRRLYDLIRENPQSLMQDIYVQMSDHMPEDVKVEGVAYLLVGGGSDGFAIGGDFYVGLHFYKDDYVGLKLLMSHEIYHLAQAQFFPFPIGSWKGATSIEDALNETLLEGSAALVGDPTVIDGGAYIEWFQKKYVRNMSRIKQNFLLLELILYRLSSDPSSRFGTYYSLGFSGGWDSPLYFVGYKMAKTIRQYKGQARLVEAYRQGSLAFFKEYIEIYRDQSSNELVRFSPEIECIILGPEEKCDS